MGSLFRSEEMTLAQLFLQSEAAYACVRELGEIGKVQFRDLNPDVSAFQRKFTNDVRRCDEMERKLRFLLNELEKAGIEPRPSGSVEAPDPQDMIDLESKFEVLEAEVKEINANKETLKRNLLDLIELQHILQKTQTFFMEAEQYALATAVTPAPYHAHPPGEVTSDEEKEDKTLVDTDPEQARAAHAQTKFTFVTGVIAREKLGVFERILWRACRGNVFLRRAEIETPLENPTTGQMENKVVFILFFQGDQLRNRVRKICEGFHATLYQCPETAPEREEMTVAVANRINDLQSVLRTTEDHSLTQLQEIGQEIDTWQTKVKKIKAIYHTMNMFNLDVTQRCLIAECWCPVEELDEIQRALTRGTERSGSTVPSILNRMKTSEQPPTYHKVNKFTRGFQAIVDAYGVATYQEVNPTPYTIITFPFLFAVMFGDAGHGLIMAVFALCLIIFEKKLANFKRGGEMFGTIFDGRYIVFLMGLFSIYTGLIYNDVFSKSLNIFGSSWNPAFTERGLNQTATKIDDCCRPGNNCVILGGPQAYLSVFPREAMALYKPYPFGLDPIWSVADNKLVFTNSYKMKMAVILGIGQMLFGVILSIFNHIHFKRFINIFVEFIPQVLFLMALFGWLVFLIFFKWCYRYDDPNTAPSLLITLINMFLEIASAPKVPNPDDPTSTENEYSVFGPSQATAAVQRYLHVILVIVAVVCIPWMLCIKPFYLLYKHKRELKRMGGYTRSGSYNITPDGDPPSPGSDDSADETKEILHNTKESKHVGQEEADGGGGGGGGGEHGEFDFSEVFIHQAIHTIEYCLGTISNTASYLRLWALSLAHADPTLTVENVAGVIEKVVVDKRRLLWERVLGNYMYSSEKAKTDTCSDVYVNCHPESSWEHLTSLLYEKDELTAVDQARLFLPPRDLTLTTDRLTELFQSVEDPDKLVFVRSDGSFVPGIGRSLGLPESALEEIKRSYQSKTKRKEAYLDTYIHRHPCPSWKKISELLKKYSLEQQAGEVEDTYIQVSERTQHYFDIAMKGGTLMIRNGGVFFLGPGGSGKTCTLHALLLEPPPSVRQSTPCAKRTVRTIAQCKVGVEGVYFIRIQDDQYSDMLSTTAKQLQPQPPSISTATPIPAEEGAMSREDASVPSPASVSHHIEEADSHTTKQEENPDVSPEKKQKKPSFRRSGFEKELLRRMQLVPKRSENLIDKDLIDMKDSGGQPMFHEVLPLFVKNTTFGVLTVKLNERLDSYPMVDYYSNGKPVGEPFPSPFTHLQTFRHCMRVLQSTCSKGTCPKLVFIGTHKDLEQDCLGENREEKNRKLRSIIPPDLKQSILYYEHSNEELLFGVNVKAPEDIDRKMIGCVRERMIKELRKLPQEKIPLQYFALENAFLRLAKYQRKGVLSKEDCFQEAAAFHFTKESFEAALKYLHGLKLIFYYEEVLPEVVFIDAQTILDKITELVEFNLSVSSQSKPVHELTISMDIKEFQEFKAYGIVTLELLSQFSSHYVPDLFMQQQLASLLKYLRVIAEVGKDKYLMPCLLRVSAIPRLLPRSTGPSISALFFYFGPNGPKLGVYCFLLASLITEAKWKLVTENDRPVQVSRNQVQFRLSGDDPGVITITDSFSTSFHVSIDFPEDMEADESLQISSRVCPGIREIILSTVQKVSHRLNYNDSIPKVAFPCTKHLPDAIHPATISSTGFLTCTIHPTSVYSRLTEQHQIWFGEEVHANIKGVDRSRQVLDQVIDSDHSGVPVHLGQIADSMYEWEGPVADSLGLHQADVAEIKEAHSGKLKLQARAALEKWKQYNGPRATYRKLIASFEQAGHKNFASKVYDIAGVHSTVTESKIESGQAKARAGAQKKHESTTIAAEGDKKPQLAKAFKFLIPIAEEWQNIGTLLELEDNALTSIAAAGKKDIDRLREMLKLWISQEDPVPSWEALAEAVEPFSGEVVAKVKSQCA